MTTTPDRYRGFSRSIVVRHLARCAVSFALFGLGCSSQDSNTDSGSLDFPGSGSSVGSAGVFGASPDGTDFANDPTAPGMTAAGGGVPVVMEPPPPPPEQEVETSFQVPVATGSYVWAANPDSGRVALVHAKTLEVRTVEAGLAPKYLVAVPTADGQSKNAALVLNEGSNDATFFQEDADGRLTSETVGVHDNANAWTVSASGRWAIAWSNAAAFEDADPIEGFQDITVIDLAAEPLSSTRLSVGYRPSAVVIEDDEAAAYVVAQSSISVVLLSGDTPTVPRDVLLEQDPGAEPPPRDVSITSDGRFALVRTEERPTVDIIELESGETRTVTLSDAVTDLDLTEDGRLAVAVVRGSAEVALLRVPDIFEDPTSFEVYPVDGQTVGSVALPADGRTALLYTNAVDSEWLTIMDLETLEQRTVALKSAVRAVFPLADSSFAVALLNPGDSSVRAGAFAVVPVASNLPPKIQGTDGRPVAVTTMTDPSRALVTVRTDGGPYGTYLVRMPELQVDFVRLPNPPLATGIVVDEKVGYVAQEHPEGRITFVDLETGGDQTLTGFELAAKVIDGE